MRTESYETDKIRVWIIPYQQENTLDMTFPYDPHTFQSMDADDSLPGSAFPDEATIE